MKLRKIKIKNFKVVDEYKADKRLRGLFCRENTMLWDMNACGHKKIDSFSFEDRKLLKKLKRKRLMHKIGDEYCIDKKIGAFLDEILAEDFYIPRFPDEVILRSKRPVYESIIKRAGIPELRKNKIVTKVKEVDRMIYKVAYTAFIRPNLGEYIDLNPDFIESTFHENLNQYFGGLCYAIKDTEALGYIIRHPTYPQKFKVNPKYVLLLEGSASLLLLPSKRPSSTKYLKPYLKDEDGKIYLPGLFSCFANFSINDRIELWEDIKKSRAWVDASSLPDIDFHSNQKEHFEWMLDGASVFHSLIPESKVESPS